MDQLPALGPQGQQPRFAVVQRVRVALLAKQHFGSEAQEWAFTVTDSRWAGKMTMKPANAAENHVEFTVSGFIVTVERVDPVAGFKAVTGAPEAFFVPAEELDDWWDKL